MKKTISLLIFSFCLLTMSESLNAVTNFREIYPPVVQQINGTLIYEGDQHGNFEGDYVAYLSDGSCWKVHPNDREKYESWSQDDLVRIKVRTSFYWFKREHKFSLYNYNRGEEVFVMLVRHADMPIQKRITQTDMYIHSYNYVTKYRTEYYWKDGNLRDRVVAYSEAEPVYRKVIVLSDGSHWVIKEKMNDFTIGQSVYLGAQGVAKKWYDFILITGTEREAVWTWARPHVMN